MPGPSSSSTRSKCCSSSLSQLDAVEDLLTRGNGAARQIVVYEANHDLREVMAEIVARDSPLIVTLSHPAGSTIAL